MITHSSKQIEAGYEQPRAIRLPLILPETADNPRRQINTHEAITAEMLAELDQLPADKPPILTEGQKYGAPTLIDGVVVILVVQKTVEEITTESNMAKKQTCDMIDEAAEHYISHRLNSAGFFMVERMLKYDPPNQKALDVSAWVELVAMEGELRKALVYADLWPDNNDPNDFSDFEEKPFSAAQLMAEYTGLS